MIESANRALFEALNGLVGASWLLDSLIALALDNPVMKAGPIAAAFLYAWHRGRRPEAGRRRVLLVTLAALLVVAPASKLLSGSFLAPRPLLMAQPTYALTGGEVARLPATGFRSLEHGDVAERVAALRDGRVDPNDLHGFPSDHAAFFIAFALGILLASRGAGLVALGWALFVTLGSRVAAGMHWPIDMAVGALAGALLLGAIQLALDGRRGRWIDRFDAWSERFPGWKAALIFLILIEATNVLQTVRRLAEIGLAVLGRVA